MKREVIVKGLGRKYALTPTNVINDGGGEGAVYRIDAGRAMKIFHEPEKQKEKIGDLEKLFRLNGKNPWPGLASIATVPEYLATDIDRKTIGYVMQNLQGWRDLNRLYAEDSGVSLKGVLNIFAKLHRAISACHDAGFVIGDLNGSNVLISALGDDAEVRIIDTDGWGMDRPDLGVSHGPYALDPEAIHPLRLRATEMNLPLPPFTPKEDWWTFTYLLTKCLTNRDPFEDGAYEFWDVGGDVLSAEDRRMMGRAAMHSGIDLGPAEEYARHLRMGIPLKHIIKRWLSCALEGPFPFSLIEATMGEMILCPNCGEEIHGRLVICPVPRCGHFL